MKKIIICILIGNFVHFASREAGSILKAYRNRECKRSKTSEMCKEASILEQTLLFEIDLGSKIIQ